MWRRAILRVLAREVLETPCARPATLWSGAGLACSSPPGLGELLVRGGRSLPGALRGMSARERFGGRRCGWNGGMMRNVLFFFFLFSFGVEGEAGRAKAQAAETVVLGRYSSSTETDEKWKVCGA